MTASASTPLARTQARQAFEQLQVAMYEAAATLVHEAELVTAMLTSIDAEPSLSDVAANFPIAEERNRLTAALDRYETYRRDARLALWRAMLDEGRSIGEISRNFGLSRQLVSRQLRDDRHSRDASSRRR